MTAFTIHFQKASTATHPNAEQTYHTLSSDQQNLVHGKIYELAKMSDATIHGDDWGRHHATEDTSRLTKALYRCGFLDEQINIPVSYSGAGSSYYSLTEKTTEPSNGRLAYVNGEGQTLEQSGTDAAKLSGYLGNHRIYCVHHHRSRFEPSATFANETKTLTQTACLIAQQIIDYLDQNTGKNLLQMAHKEGAVPTIAALRLIEQTRPTIFNRIRVITFAPEQKIDWTCFTTKGLQVINLSLKAGKIITSGYHDSGASGPMPTSPKSFSPIGSPPPDNFPAKLMEAAIPHFEEFEKTGNLYDEKLVS